MERRWPVGGGWDHFDGRWGPGRPGQGHQGGPGVPCGVRYGAGSVYVDGGPALAAKLHTPGGVTADSAGNLVFADIRNNRVRVVANKSGTFHGKKMTDGFIYTVAGNGTAGYAGDGGAATKAELTASDVTVDGPASDVTARLASVAGPGGRRDGGPSAG